MQDDQLSLVISLKFLMKRGSFKRDLAFERWNEDSIHGWKAMYPPPIVL